ncbi:MAG TPA: ATP-binding protein, partial [Anaeromyxobacteraceae bacterium]|nr:ATP-binding protein [Anaeromyxobacteraceae bacterium]
MSAAPPPESPPTAPCPPGEPSTSLEALRALVEATAITGERFFDTLVVNLTRSLGVRHALVGEVDSADPERLKVLAVAWDGKLGARYTYDLAGTPCQGVVRAGELAYYPSGVAQLFPDEGLIRRGAEAFMGVPLVAPDGARIGALVVLHDGPIDERKEPAAILRIFAGRAAAELTALRGEALARERDNMLRYALHAARMVTFDVDLVRRVGAWSDGAAELLGRTEATFDGSFPALLDCTVPEDRARLVEANDAIRAGRMTRVDLSFRIALPGGRERWLQARGTVATGPDGRGVRLSGVMADVTERRRLEEQLQQSLKLDAIGRLAGGIAHDFNNLLTVIRSYGQLAEEALDERHPARELVTPICEAADRGAALTRQLLAFARRQVIQPRLVDPCELVAALGRLLRRLLGDSVDLQLDLAVGAWPVRIDPGQLEQVLVNLAVNARDAMPAGGTLVIAAQNAVLGPDEAAERLLRPGEHVLVRVRDGGAGMDEATARRAFEPFFTTKGPDHGTGLGLATCHGIVAEHGGTLTVESVPGRGTRFVMTLPRRT